MSVLDHLPLELVTEILLHLPSADLARVCYVSRQMRAVSQRVLYTAPSLTSTRHSNPPSLQLLLRRLLSPGGDTLAEHVRSLSVLWDNVDSDDAQFPEDMALFAAAGARFDRSHSVLSQGNQVMLLLHLLPRLEVLELGPPQDCNAFTHFLQTPHAPLRQLRQFRQHPAATNTWIPIPAIHTLLRLPFLRNIDVRTAYGSATAPAVPCTSSITSLRLRHSSISPGMLHDLLILPTALTHFSFSPEVWDSNFDISSFSLAPLSETLTHLHVDLSGIARNRLHGDLMRRPMCNLRGWPVLHTVRCPLMGLLGQARRRDGPRLAAVLPTGLRDLEILGDIYWSGKEKVGKVVEMLEEKASMLPVLKRLVMSVGRSGDVLSVACQTADVVLVVRKAGGVDTERRGIRYKEMGCWRGSR